MSTRPPQLLAGDQCALDRFVENMDAAMLPLDVTSHRSMSTDLTHFITLERVLWHQAGSGSDERVQLRQSGLIDLARPLIVLGEAGMGKSTLLAWLAEQPGYALCTARGFINRHDPGSLLGNASVLVIDALDEVVASRDGEAVDTVLRKLGELGYPRFVLSCRTADWRSATGAEAIREQYVLKPLELYLEPLTESDIDACLTARLGSERAAEVREHFFARGLDGMLGNPQTLQLVVDVVASGHLPETKQELFGRAVALMWREHKASKAGQQPAETAGLDAAGAACAALIITGSEAVARAMVAGHGNGDLPIRDIALLPGGAMADAVLDTRLFRALGNDRFNYWHRSIGEFLGAQWLARHADTPRKRRRLLSLLRSQGLVPASLRGLHAWLAHDPNLAQDVIDTDPLGFIEYGDAEVLTLSQARHLLVALQREMQRNPHYHAWHMAAAKGLFQAGLVGEIRTIIASDDTAFWLRSYLIESARGTPAVAALRGDLQRMVTDHAIPLGLRMPIVDTLSGELGDDDWRAIIKTLRHARDTDTIRLVLHILDVVAHHLLDDAAIAELAIAATTADDKVIGVLFPLEQHLPLDRLDCVLDELVAKIRAFNKPHQGLGEGLLTGFAYALMARRLASAEVPARQLWAWLELVEAGTRYSNGDQSQVDAYLRDHDVLRREIQHLVLLELPEGGRISEREWLLANRSAGLNLSPDDIVVLLGALDPVNASDTRWRDLVARWGSEESVREAARPFAAHDPEQLAWLDAFANPPPEPEWAHEHARHRLEREEHKARIRDNYLAHINEVRAGKFGAILGPAQAYLNLFGDLRKDLPAHQRVAQWLGADVGTASHEGFEAFLQAGAPSITDIVEALSQDKFLAASCIVIVAMAERRRRGVGLADLPDERVMAGFFALQGGGLTCQAKLDELESFVEDEIRRRGLLETALRQYCEPQLRAGKGHIGGLDTLMRGEACVEFATRLALDWLDAFDQLSINVTRLLVSRVVHSGQAGSLRPYLDRHVAQVEPGQRAFLDAADILVNFDRTTARLAQTGIAPDLLWELRDLDDTRTSKRQLPAQFDPAVMEWVVATFRTLWPMRYRPSDGWSGNRNPWEASEYLIALLRRLALDCGEHATKALHRLHAAAMDGYTDTLASLVMEQATLRAEAAYVSPPLDAIAAVVNDATPATIDDLLAVVLDELATVQAKIRSDDVESWRGFFDSAGVPLQEEPCRDHLVGLFRQGCRDIHFEPEAHKAGDKEVDIACRCSRLSLPIEVKGQWHRDLWHAADTQLDRLYATDWQAERRGVYLVLWFGQQSASNKRLAHAPRGVELPRTPADLESALAARSAAARDGRIAIVVLDVAHA